MGDANVDTVYHALLVCGYPKRKAHQAAVECIRLLDGRTDEENIKAKRAGK